MNRITNNTNTVVNTELVALRASEKEFALVVRKVFGNLKCKAYETIPTTSAELATSYNGAIPSYQVASACGTLINWMSFEEVDEVEVPEIALDDVDTNDRFAFIETTEYEDMTASQLATLLFRDLGTEVEVSTSAMTAGLKLKLDMLDELKANLVNLYPEIRTEVLTAKLANALAVTKLEKGSSLALSEGNLAVYKYMATDKVIDSENFKFLAEIGADKTKALDILILESVFKTYKEEVARGHLPTTSSDLNLAIMKMTSGVLATTIQSLEGLQDLF